MDSKYNRDLPHNSVLQFDSYGFNKRGPAPGKNECWKGGGVDSGCYAGCSTAYEWQDHDDKFDCLKKKFDKLTNGMCERPKECNGFSGKTQKQWVPYDPKCTPFYC